MTYTTTYRGYTLTLLSGTWRIAGITYVTFTTQLAAELYIDKLLNRK